MIERFILTAFAACFLSATTHGAPPHADGRVRLSVACVTAEDALELGAAVDRKLPNVEDILYEKLASGACLTVPPDLRREDSTLVEVVASELETDVWRIKTDDGRVLYVAYDREPSL